MKVKELIALLEGMPGDAVVGIRMDANQWAHFETTTRVRLTPVHESEADDEKYAWIAEDSKTQWVILD